jgi:hypothetical protein
MKTWSLTALRASCDGCGELTGCLVLIARIFDFEVKIDCWQGRILICKAMNGVRKTKTNVSTEIQLTLSEWWVGRCRFAEILDMDFPAQHELVLLVEQGFASWYTVLFVSRRSIDKALIAEPSCGVYESLKSSSRRSTIAPGGQKMSSQIKVRISAGRYGLSMA